jgi:ligand-binding sensor domain-containing protein
LPGTEIQFLKSDGHSLWVGTLGGLAVLREGAAETIVKDEAVWDMETMPDGSAWVGTDKGILRLDGNTPARSLSGASVGRLVRFGHDSCWAIADRGDVSQLLELKDGKWTPAPYFIGKAVADLFPTGSGTVWVILDTNGIVAANPEQESDLWIHHLEGINIRAFHKDSRGRVWCGTWGRGIMVLEGGKWTRHMAGETAVFTAIEEDGNGHIWAATNANGLWQFNGERWINHLRDEGVINVLQAPGDGNVYISSQSNPALRVWTGAAWKTVADAPTMFRTVMLGPDGKLWAGNTLDGLYRQP